MHIFRSYLRKILGLEKIKLVIGFSSLVVIRSVLNKKEIKYACLGTVFNLPMTTVTIIEDLLIVAMAVLMLWTT